MIEDFDELRDLETPAVPTEQQEEPMLELVVTQADIVEAIKICLTVSPLIKPSKTLISTVYNTLKTLLLDDKKYVILECPTGSGKTIIGFMLHFCIHYLYQKQVNGLSGDARPRPSVVSLSYFLTSSKMLQEQIDKDLVKFDFRDYIAILKGTANYECLYATEEAKRFNYGKLPKDFVPVSYRDRPCKGMNREERETNFGSCVGSCPYASARDVASQSTCAVLNYAYFLNIMRSEFNPFFGKHYLTIADEAHLAPDIVTNIFNYVITQYTANQIDKIVGEVAVKGGDESVRDIRNMLSDIFLLFRSKLDNPLTLLTKYFEPMSEIRVRLNILSKDERFASYKQNIINVIESIDEIVLLKDEYQNFVTKRLGDVFFVSEEINKERSRVNAAQYKHIVRDMSESVMVNKHLLSKINKGVFMSATLGNIEEYASLMGMEEGTYSGFRLDSTFDFSRSPIYLCESGYLDFKNFDSNIDGVLMDCLKICNQLHPNEKGIIHTSTFKIADLLQQKINMGLASNPDRFLFYRTSEEKEACVEKMKTSTVPYVIVGASLYEGLDLIDDQGRFNILLKVPYAGMSDYVKQKMERYPFWYMRNTLEKIVQAIGRTNRHVNDYSTVYLLDTGFAKLIYKTNDAITSRIKKKKI